jgi:hypothetical protein
MTGAIFPIISESMPLGINGLVLPDFSSKTLISAALYGFKSLNFACFRTNYGVINSFWGPDFLPLSVDIVHLFNVSSGKNTTPNQRSQARVRLHVRHKTFVCP